MLGSNVLNHVYQSLGKSLKGFCWNLSPKPNIISQASKGSDREEVSSTEIPEERIFPNSCEEQLKAQYQMAKEVFGSSARAKRTSLACDGHTCTAKPSALSPVFEETNSQAGQLSHPWLLLPQDCEVNNQWEWLSMRIHNSEKIPFLVVTLFREGSPCYFFNQRNIFNPFPAQAVRSSTDYQSHNFKSYILWQGLWL